MDGLVKEKTVLQEERKIEIADVRVVYYGTVT